MTAPTRCDDRARSTGPLDATVVRARLEEHHQPGPGRAPPWPPAPATLDGVLFADDTEAMLDVPRGARHRRRARPCDGDVEVARATAGGSRRPPPTSTPACRAPPRGSSLPVLALGAGPVPARRRPRRCGPARWDPASRPLRRPRRRRRRGAAIPGHLPVAIGRRPGHRRPRSRLPGERVEPVRLRAAAGRAVPAATGWWSSLAGELVSRPYVDMTDGGHGRVRGAGRAGPTTAVSPSPRTATGPRPTRSSPTRRRRRTSSPPPRSRGGRVRGRAGSARARSRATSRFVDVLEQMGAEVDPGRGLHRGAGHRHAARRRRRPGRPVRHGPDPGRGGGLRRRADRRSPASGSSGARRPTASPPSSPSCAGPGSRPTETDDGFRIVTRARRGRRRSRPTTTTAWP